MAKAPGVIDSIGHSLLALAQIVPSWIGRLTRNAISSTGRSDAGTHPNAEALESIIEPLGWDDWYSDHLFECCLGQMVPAVEPFLWSLIRNRKREPQTRGLALCALREIAERHPARQRALADEIADFLKGRALLDRRRKQVNAFAAHVLDTGDFPKEVVVPAIITAHEAGRLDLAIYNLDEIQDLEFWD